MPEFNKNLLNAAVILLIAFLGVETLQVLKNVGQPDPNPHTIVVTGDGEAFATPNIAEFNFTVSVDGKTVGDAQDAVTSKIDSITAALNGLGISEKDIRTTDYSVYPKYTYQTVVCPAGAYCPPGRAIPDGYTVSHSIDVKVRKISDAGQALSVVGGKGATNVSSLNFTVDNPDSIMDDARNQAVDKAHTKAEALAKSLGVRLGRVVSFNDNTATPFPIYGLGAGVSATDMKSVAPTIPTGQNKITSNVTITYEIR